MQKPLQVIRWRGTGGKDNPIVRTPRRGAHRHLSWLAIENSRARNPSIQINCDGRSPRTPYNKGPVVATGLNGVRGETLRQGTQLPRPALKTDVQHYAVGIDSCGRGGLVGIDFSVVIKQSVAWVDFGLRTLTASRTLIAPEDVACPLEQVIRQKVTPESILRRPSLACRPGSSPTV